MVRLLVLAFAFLGLLGTPLVAAAQQPTLPRINPLTGKPFSQKARDEFDREMAEIDKAERIAREVSDREEARRAELRKKTQHFFDEQQQAIDAWRKDHPAPPGTTTTLTEVDVDTDVEMPSGATVAYENRMGDVTHEVTFDGAGRATSGVTQTQVGKAWETIDTILPPDGLIERVYGEDLDGNEVIQKVRIYHPNGRLAAEYDFNYDGVAWRGEKFDAEGHRTGAFEKLDMRPPPRTLGGPLAEPPGVRSVTGICEECKALADQLNDLAARINRIAAEMRSLSEQHQHAYQPAQKPIQVRHAVLTAELAELMTKYQALLPQVEACQQKCYAAREKPPEPPQAAVMPDAPPPAPPARPAISEANFVPGSGAIPADNRDLQQVLDAAQAYLAAANCEGMECPVCDCDEARKALQALTDMEAYLRAMEPYMAEANADHFARLKNVAEANIQNGKQRDRTIRAIGLHEFYQNFGSMLLDIASVSSWIKETLQGDGLENMSPYEMLDKLDGWYEAAKDLESLVNTGAQSLTGEDQASPVADLVGGGDNKDLINDTTSTIADAKSIIVAALKSGKDWRAALKKEGAAAALGQIAGRYLKLYANKVLDERKAALDELLRDAEAGDLQQAQAYIELQKVQLRRQMLEDALAAVTAAKARYADCVWRACVPMTVTRPQIPSFVQSVPGARPKLSWGTALPWFNKAIAETLARMQPVRFREGDCPKKKEEPPRTATGQPATTPQTAGDAPPLSRPQFQRVPDVQLPASFCSEEDRNRFMTEVYNPAVAAALSNANIAQNHQAELNALFTQHMRANSPWWGKVREERDAFEPIAAESITKAEALRQLYGPILAVPIVPCDDRPRTATGPATPPVEGIPVIPGPATTPAPPATPRPKKDDCPPKQGRKPIVVGPNSRVGSGAQLRGKLGGMALGALAGAAGLGGGGGGGGSDGPQLWTCKIKDSEFTVFNDPLTGVSLAVGAKRAGGKLVIFSKVEKAPDKGTFQTAFLERPSTGETIAPSDVGPCDLWGEWKLTVSWTKSTYVDGALVSRESGGWSEGGFFKIPGVLSKVDAPDGLWKRMGFSNASNGARQIATVFNAPAGGGPLTFVVHVTRPKQDPVDTVPFVLTLTEGPDGKIAITKAEDPPCPEPIFSDSEPDFHFPMVNDAGLAFTPQKPPPSDAPPESILDDVDDGPPVLTGGTGIGGTTPPQYGPSRPPTDPYNDDRRDAFLEDWLAEDLLTLDKMHDPDSCTPDLRRQLVERIQGRMEPKTPTTPLERDEAIPLAEAQKADSSRAKALLDWLSEDPEACRPPSTIPREAYTKPKVEHFEAAPAPYTPPPEETPRDNGMVAALPTERQKVARLAA